MTRQEKYDRLVERLGSAENFDNRPREIWTEEEVEIYTQRETLKNYLEDIETATGDKKAVCENNFDKLYSALWNKLDELGWK